MTLATGIFQPSVAPEVETRPDLPHPKSQRQIYEPATGAMVPVPVYWRFDLKPGMTIPGPALIAEHETSTMVPASFDAGVNGLGYLIMERRS